MAVCFYHNNVHASMHRCFYIKNVFTAASWLIFGQSDRSIVFFPSISSTAIYHLPLSAIINSNCFRDLKSQLHHCSSIHIAFDFTHHQQQSLFPLFSISHITIVISLQSQSQCHTSLAANTRLANAPTIPPPTARSPHLNVNNRAISPHQHLKPPLTDNLRRCP